jgi:hypothetical protein
MNDLFYSLYRDFVLQFLAELMNLTQTATAPDAFQRALQSYCDDLRPWVSPADAPHVTHPIFALFDECTISKNTDEITVHFSPEGEVLFRSWLRRRGVMEETARAMDPGWPH